jgi:transposase
MSSTRKAYLYRLYPTDEQAHALQHQLDVARELYNACLLERREAYGMAHLTLNYYDQAKQLKDIRQIRPDFASVNFSMLQQTCAVPSVVWRANRKGAATGSSNAAVWRACTRRSPTCGGTSTTRRRTT